MNTNIKQKGLSLGLLLLVILTSCFFYSFTSSSIPFVPVNTTELIIVLGRGPSCTGRGICSLTETGTSQNQRGDAKGKLYYNSSNKLTLDIYKQNISVWDMNQQIVNDKFKLIDSYTIPSTIMSGLGTVGSYTINTGEYDVNETSSSFIIEF